MKLYATIVIYEVGRNSGFEKIHTIKNVKAEKAIKQAVDFINRKYTNNFFKNLKIIGNRIKHNIKNG